MAKKKNNKKEAAAAPARAPISISASLKPFAVLVVLVLIVAAASLFNLQKVVAPQIEDNIQRQKLTQLSVSANTLMNQKIAFVQKQLASLAQSQFLQSLVVSDDANAFKQANEFIQKSFSDNVSLQLIPWDYTATVGLKERGIEPRNNIEMLMLTKAGGNSVPSPEVYQVGKQWLISFAQPIEVNQSVSAIILLSYDQHFFDALLKNDFYQSLLSIQVVRQDGPKQLKTVASNNKTGVGGSVSSNLGFSDGHLIVANMQTSSALVGTAIQIGTVVNVACVVVLLVALLLLFVLVKRAMAQDVDKLGRFIDTLTGLHKTKAPDFAFTELSPLIENLEVLSQSMQHSAVTPSVGKQKKSVLSGASLEAKPANAEVVERASFAFPHIFRDYDIRGHADKELGDENVELIGKAIASEAKSLNIQQLVLGRDGRLSSPRIFQSLSKTLLACGIDVVDIGIVPTPVLYFACEKSPKQSGVMITASHNDKDDNGFKIVLAGKALKGDLVRRLLQRIEREDFAQFDGAGQLSQDDALAAYQEAAANDILIAKPMKVVIDASNGVGGELASRLLKQLNCQVVLLNGEVDGNFPKHSPDPSRAENLQELSAAVVMQQADLGIAFDGDADRMVAVTGLGEIVDGDKLLIVFAKDIVSRNPAASVIYDVKCSASVREITNQYGGKAIMWKTGHANIKAKMQETGALLGGELTGHYCFKERWFGFDDGIYSMLRLIELLSNDGVSLDQSLQKLPSTSSTADLLIITPSDALKFDIIKQLQTDLGQHSDGEVSKIDGIRIDYPDGWGLVRASNTRSALTARFEAQTTGEMLKIQNVFKQALLAVDNSLTLPF